MLKDREKLSEMINELLIVNNSNEKLRLTIEKDLEDKFEIGMVNRIYNLQRQLVFLSEEQLYLVTKSLYEHYDIIVDFFSKKKNQSTIKSINVTRDEIKPELWFTEIERKNAHAIKIKTKSSKNEKRKFVLNNVDFVKDGLWISSHDSIQNVVDNWETGALDYNPETQRKGIIKFVSGKTYIIPKLVDKNVNEMKQAMINGNFFMNMITVNIQSFEDEERQYITYFPNERRLEVEITDKSAVYLIDGGHRTMSAKKALLEEPNLDEYFAVRVFNTDEETAQQIILQEQLGTPLDNETVKYFDRKNPYVRVAEKINNLGSSVNNAMYHKLTKSLEEVGFNLKYCLFSNIANGLEDNFSDIIENANPYKLDKLAKYLVEFYNTFIGMFDNYFSDLKSTKEKYVVADINIFTGLLVIARKLYETEDWQSELENILKNIDWDRQNKEWERISTKTTTWNKSTKTEMYNFFINKISYVEVATDGK